MAEWTKAPVSKTGRVFKALVGSNPTPSERLEMSKKKTAEKPSKREIQKNLLHLIEEEKVFLLIKAPSFNQMLEAYQLARDGGFNLIALDFKTQGVKEHLKTLKRAGEQNLGVFSISTKKEARTAINAGALFLFSTHLDKGIIKRSKKESVFHAAGSLTPTEVFSAYDLGANAASVFPCKTMGGIGWIGFLRELFPKIKLIPTDTINPDEVIAYLRAGAYAVASIIEVGKEHQDMLREFIIAKNEGKLSVS